MLLRKFRWYEIRKVHLAESSKDILSQPCKKKKKNNAINSFWKNLIMRRKLLTFFMKAWTKIFPYLFINYYRLNFGHYKIRKNMRILRSDNYLPLCLFCFNALVNVNIHLGSYLKESVLFDLCFLRRSIWFYKNCNVFKSFNETWHIINSLKDIQHRLFSDD